MRYPSSAVTGKRRIFATVAALVLSGCAAVPVPPEGKLFERGGISMVVVPGSSRETYFSDPKSQERHCRAPSPDVSLTASEGVALNAPSLTGKGVGVSEDASTGALSLGGRSPSVLISRELLYRACELTNNLNLPPDQALKLFQDVMATITRISATQQGGGGTASLAARPLDARVQAPSPAPVPVPAIAPGGGFSPMVPNAIPQAIPGSAPDAPPSRW